jgi:two-component system, LuxR family, response regulator FixJ
MSSDQQQPEPAPKPMLVVVDDDPRIRLSLHGLFSSAGIDVRTYGSADALESSVLNASGCFISDIRMPVTDGWELQRRIAESRPCVPLIFITAHQDEKTRQRAISSGAFALVYKPFDGEELLRIVYAALRSGGSPQVEPASTIVTR